MNIDKLTYSNIDYALWEVTSNCTFSCIHCRASASPLSMENHVIEGMKAKELLISLAKLKTKTLVLTGGEPLLRQDLEELVSYANSLGMRCRIQSNGFLLTKSRIGSLKEAGIISFGIGLDSPFSECHDQIRQYTGSYEKAINAIKLVNESGLSCHVETTLMKGNIHHLPQMFKLLNELKVNTFLLRSTIFCGRPILNTENFSISSSEYHAALKEFYNLSGQYPDIVAGSQDPLYHMINPTIMKSINKWGDYKSGKIICGCTLGINTIHIRSTGTIGLCTFLPDITLGNIYKNNLEEIWQQRFSCIQDLSSIVNRQYNGSCGKCDHRYICGGCRARALSINHNMLDNDPYCWYFDNNGDT